MKTLEQLLIAKGWRGRGLDFAAGAIAVLGLAPFYIWPLAILSFGWLALRWHRSVQTSQQNLEQDPKRAAKLCRSSGFWFGLGYFLFGLFWISSAFIARGPSFIPLMVPAVLLLCAALSLFWTLAGHIYAKLRPHGIWAPVVFASLLSMAEILRGHIFSGFPWNLPGYIFKAGSAVSQIASLIGIYGLSFLVLLLAGYLAHCLAGSGGLAGNSEETTQTPTPYERRAGLRFMGILFVLFGFGFLRLSLAAPLEFHKDVKLRIVQTPFAQKDNLDPGGSIQITNDYLTQTAEAGLEDVTHVIWPEGAINGLALENEALLRAISDLFLSFDNTPPHWLVSTLRQETRPLSDGPNSTDQSITYYYNSSASVSFGADGSAQISAINDKVKLVPFGEGLPYASFFEKLGVSPMSTASSFVTPAPTKELADFPGLPKLSPQICYEIIFSGMTPRRGSKDASAQWILNQSNDGWYGKSSGPRQHANQSAYRAIEEGLPIVRAAGNGISGVIDPYGRWREHAQPDARVALDAKLPKSINPPVYSGNIIWLLFLINSAICLLYNFRWSKQRGVVKG